MKFRDHFSIVILVVAIVGTAFSQESTENDKKSGSDLQAWLAVAIEKNGSHSIGRGKFRLTDVVISGCTMSFVSEGVWSYDNPEPPSQGPTASSRVRINRRDMKQTSSYRFDLGEINPSEISLRYEHGKTQTLLLPTIDRDQVVEYSLKMTDFPATTRMVNVISIRLKNKVIEEVREKLVAVIRACQSKRVS
ncbi:MAG TPA: hypothetical protein VL572_14140 [Pyrinomonadaceae bacterium]|nr:hypothetical protein [Pyrinomonadaceae bacterium]